VYLKSLLFALGLFLLGAVQAQEVKLQQGGLTLNANLDKVAGNWPQGPVVLITHGTLAHRGMEIISALQEMLTERGISSLAINLSLGLNDRPASMYPCEIPHTHKHTDAVEEIALWVGWLKRQGAERIALLGHSRGGNQVARYMVAHPDPAVEKVFLVAPATWDPGHEEKGYKRRYNKALMPILKQAKSMVAAGKGKELMRGVDFIYCKETSATAEAFVSYYDTDERMDTPHLVPRIKVPVVVFAGSEDQVVKGLIGKMEPIADGERVRLMVIDGADHFFRDLFSEDIADTLAEALGAG